MDPQLIIISFIGAILSLDRILAQTMISRPIVSGAIVGLVLNNFNVGLMAGAIIELLWIDESPLGTSVPPNDTVSAVLVSCCTILALKSLGGDQKEIMAFSLLILLPTGIIAQKLDIWIFKTNDKLSKRAVEAAALGELSCVSRAHCWALTKSFVMTFVFLLVTSAVGQALIVRFYPSIPVNFSKSLTYVFYFIPIVGVAVTLNTIHLKNMMAVFCSLFLLLAVIRDILFKVFR